MPAPVGAKVFKNAVVTIDAVEYANQLSRARLVPETNTQTFRTLVPDGSVSDDDSPVWTFELAGLQINVANGLAKALRDATPGEELEVELQDEAGVGKPMATFTMKAKPVPFGGTTGQFLQMEDLTFAVVGQPVFGTSS